MLRFYSVFNIEQSEGIAPPPAEETHNHFDPIERAEQIVAGMPLKPDIRYGEAEHTIHPLLNMYN
jgi:antirestriction protein ArdC